MWTRTARPKPSHHLAGFDSLTSPNMKCTSLIIMSLSSTMLLCCQRSQNASQPQRTSQSELHEPKYDDFFATMSRDPVNMSDGHVLKRGGGIIFTEGDPQRLQFVGSKGAAGAYLSVDDEPLMAT